MSDTGIQRHPIAIIGIGLRLPGEVSSASHLWELLLHGKSGHGPVPDSRYNAKGFFHPNPDRPGSVPSRDGYFIQHDIRAFENAFFGINNLEASSMDAQQRKLLEVVYESFENAGRHLEDIKGSCTGVFIGNFTTDHMIMQYKDPEYFSRYSATGAAPTVLSNRITHCFDLRGPSVVLDTACSSSVYALHAACLSLDAHDCNAAVVASANLIQSVEQQMIAVKAGILSSDGISHSFDESANGYGRAEGVAALYLKRLDDAIADGDPIRAVIRGTAVNGNGRTPGIVQPSVDGQEAVMKTAYRRARLQPHETPYLELHATGTKVGDPIEVEAVSRVFRHRVGVPILVGALKPALGHSEGASGLSSIIKVVLALEKGVIPATIGINKVNPGIKLDEWNVALVRENQSWPTTLARRAGINSFGFGGANAHVIIDAACDYDTNQNGQSATHQVGDAKDMNQNGDVVSHSSSVHQNKDTTRGNDNVDSSTIFLFSASTQDSLTRQFGGIVDYASRNCDLAKVKNIAFTLAGRRSRMATRGFLVEPPSSFQRKPGSLCLTVNVDKPSAKLNLTFVYTGQGAQWPGFGSQLIHRFPSFRRSIRYYDQCLQALDQNLRPAWSIEGMILDENANEIHLADRSQPVCTAVQLALTNLLHDWNIKPRIVLGHSSGEIAAAYAAGYIDSRQAIMSAYLRGLSVSLSQEKGGMVAAGLSRDKVEQMIIELDLRHAICVACVNSPESTTLSGDSKAVEKLLTVLKERHMFARKLKTNEKAYHSHHMQAVGKTYKDLLQSVWQGNKTTRNQFSNGSVNDSLVSAARMISSVTQSYVPITDVATPSYWRTNLESVVEFEGAIRSVLSEDATHFVEIGPHSALELPIKETVSQLSGMQERCLYHSALSRGKDASVSLLTLVGSLFLHNHDEISFKAIFKSDDAFSHEPVQVLVDLPPYPWNYESQCPWNEPRIVAEFRNRKYPRHDLLGSRLPGGSKANISWRNVLSIEEIPWLEDHRLGPTIVFPAAAYITIAMEAVCQAHEIQSQECPGITLKHVSFLKAMNLDPEHRPRIEIFTDMEPLRLSNTTASAKWWRFTLSSISRDDTQGIIHMVCNVSLSSDTKMFTQRRIKLNRDTMEQQAARVWYDKFTREGLNWGPQFAVMEDIFCDSSRKSCVAAATTRLIRDDDVYPREHPKYLVHPITIDALLQTAFVATTHGWARNLRATVPVSIESIQVSSPAALDMDVTRAWFIDSRSEPVGFGTVNIEAELVNKSEDVLLRMQNVRAIRFQGNAKIDAREESTSLTRVAWKPDVTALAAGPNAGFSRYLDWFEKTHSEGETFAEESGFRLAGALDLIAFKFPKLRILSIDCELGSIRLFMRILRADNSLRRFDTFTQAKADASGGLYVVNDDVYSANSEDQTGMSKFVSSDSRFDVIVASTGHRTALRTMLDILAPSGFLICPETLEQTIRQETTLETIKQSTQLPSAILIARRKLTVPAPIAEGNELVLVRNGDACLSLNDSLQAIFSASFAAQISTIDFNEVCEASVPPRAIVVSTVEALSPMFSTITEEKLKRVKVLTNRASKILWITSANLLSGNKPDHALVRGIAGPLMLEQPSLQLRIFDVDNPLTSVDVTARNVRNAVEKLFFSDVVQEPELAQKDEIIHALRWEPEDILNSRLELKQNEGITEVALGDAGRCKLSIEDPGQMETLHFESNEYEVPLPTNYVEIQVKSVGMNAKDLYAFAGRVDTKDASCSCECSGVISAVGDNVEEFQVGDRVVGMAPGHFATYERFPSWAVCKLNDEEDFDTAATIPLVFATAIYGLRYRANLQPGESVLIHSAAGGVGIASIQLAQSIGAEIFVTVGHETKKDFLVEKFGVNPGHVFNSRGSFLNDILTATKGRGVDVVLNSLTGDLLHDSLKACAEFGRFVEIGRKDIIEHGNLDMASFARNISLTAFDLNSLYLSDQISHHSLWGKLLRESLELIRTRIASPCTPLRVFDAADVTGAFRYFMRERRMGKVAVSFQQKENKIPLRPNRYESRFNSEKTYLMVGCLGGLGRSLTKWMKGLGARRFVFLSRSGTDKPAARVFVESLQRDNAVVEVVRGDVGRYEDVERCVQAAKSPIGGVIQGAMALHETIWSDTTAQNFLTAVTPKVQGTWHLHNALRRDDRDWQLDFFVLMSSTAGTIGAATESNYCAANAFLDAFARYRNNLGLPAISIGYGRIAEVGYLHDHPEIETIMERRGIQSIKEDEMLQIMDLAITHQNPSTWQPCYDPLTSAHLLTGVSFSGLQRHRDRGFEGDIHVLSDPRAALFAAEFERNSAATGNLQTPLRADLPTELAKALTEGGREASVLGAVREMVGKKIANLILLPFDKLRPEQKLGEFGIDSMLAAEFRTYVFHALKVDVPFMMLLEKSTTINSLSAVIVESLKDTGSEI